MSDMTDTLRSVKKGDSFRIASLDNSLPVAGRLRELGFIEGADADKLYVGCGGGPIAVRIGGSVIAVRTEDAEHIFVSPHTDIYMKGDMNG